VCSDDDMVGKRSSGWDVYNDDGVVGKISSGWSVCNDDVDDKISNL